jgi:energy-coupling factor transporter ATP-binding protein EcfA2
MTMMNGQPPMMRSMSRIGLWGSPGSGKTTFLAALNIAVQQMPTEQLMLFGTDDASTDFLVDNTARLTRDRMFPDATVIGQQLSWVMRMEKQVPVRGKFYRQTMTTVPVEMNLDLLDEPGASFRDTPVGGGAAGSGANAAALGYDDDEDDDAGPAATEDNVMDQLAGCNGLLLLFDPTREWREGDMFNYFQGTLLRIAQRRLPGPTGPGGRLPHFVAVCVTKFDHPDVYRRAKSKGYRSFSPDDPYLFPRVPDEFAEQFFVDLVKESDRGNADLVPNALRKFFQPERVRFFVTSAIGFYLSKRASRFQEQDFMNVVPKGGGDAQIRGPIHPINVVEPLLWLGHSLSAGR